MSINNSITKETKLYSYHAEEMRLNDAIVACHQQLEGAIALLYSPQSCQLAKLMSNGTLHDFCNRAINLANNPDIFEARIFNQTYEIRWLNRMDGTGEAALIFDFKEKEQEQTIKGFIASKPISCESLEQKYILWGQKTKNPAISGWQRLAEARIGKLDIPLNQQLKVNERVYLKTYEYLAPVDEYGNFAVIEERLVKLEVI